MAEAVLPQRRTPGRFPGSINAAIAIVILVVVTTVMWRASAVAPPAIAEFAPQAQHPIQTAPAEQTAFNGQGVNGAAVAAASSPSPASSQQIHGVLHPCVGDPPRQIEDPQSPPCVPNWAGTNNGGNTWKGVSKDEIRIAWPQNFDVAAADNAFVDFFNKRFEFYGRKLVLVPAPSGDTQGYTSTSGQLADAATVDEQLKAFASMAYEPNALEGADYYYYDELARRHILSVNSWQTIVNESHYAAQAPYEWSYTLPQDAVQQNLGEFICRGLKNGPPRYAGGVQATQPKRIFGIIEFVTQEGIVYHTDTLQGVLRNCGISPTVVQYQSSSNSAQTQANASNAILQLSQAHVTSVAAFTQGKSSYGVLLPASESENYEPEWLISGLQQDDDDQGQVAPPGQAGHRIGLTAVNKLMVRDEMPFWWAIRYMDPSGSASTYQPQNGDYLGLYARYEQLLLLASGIQMAGPDLTPYTFESALFKTVFPNPGCGGPPFYQACVGFQGQKHSMTDDMVPIWWSSSDTSYSGNANTGTYCYVARGVRYQIGTWPAEELPFKQGSCR